MPTFLKILIAGILMISYTSGSLAADFWWDSNWNYRVSLTVDSGDYQRSDRPVEVAIDFTSFLAPVDLLADFDVNAIRIHEVDDTGELLLTENIPFQFDPVADFDALINAQGTLVFLLDGNTAVQTNRYFQVYFDVEGGGYTLPTFTSQVNVTDNVPDEGQDSFLISTFNADYYYQKQAGGFSSIIDDDQNDWINYHPTGGTSGSFRGIPNLVSPGDGGHFHPGATTSISTLVHEGPLKATIKSTTIDGLWEIQWEFFPEFARMTVMRAETNYWFLYEGTPGGVLDINDFVTRSNGTETDYLSRWKGDLPTEEWVYFSDAQVGRSIFFAHHEDDTFVDSYRQLNNLMTVFGFGRDDNTSLMQSQNNQFTIGLTDSIELTGTSTTISSAYKDINVVIISAEQFADIDNEAPTQPGNLTAQPASTLVDLSWDAATDNVGVALYRISRDGTEVGTTTGTSFQETGLNPDQTYNFSVIAEDANGNQSTSATVSVTTLPAGDTEAPSVPTGLIEDSATASTVVISWAASTDAQGIVASYRIFRDGTEVGISTTRSFTNTTVQADQTYLYSVSAIDDAGNESSQSTTLQVNIPTSSDTEAPSIPTGLTLNSVSANAVSFSWTPTTDNQGTVVLYHILRDGSEMGTSSVASYTDNTVAADTAYVYNVTAEDNAGNESAISADLNVDTTVPSGTELLAYYPFEEGSGSTILDLSGNGNDGTLEGNATRTSTGNSGEAIEFDGLNSHINLGSIDITSQGMSIELWFKADDFGIGDARLISKATGVAPSEHYWMISTVSSSGQHKLRFRLKTDNGGTSTLIGNTVLTAGVWTQVKATYDGVAMKLFQDNVEVGNLAKFGAIATSASVDAWIGANPGNTRYFDGLIDDVRISSIPIDPGTLPGPENSSGNRVKWSKLSSDSGDILPPGTHPQQTAALIFDINKDGVNDFIIGSRTGSGPTVVWYERTTTDWVQHVIESDSSLRLEAGGTFHDIDGDGDNDLVLGDGGAGQNIYWWENPYPNYGSGWTRRLIKTGGGFQHHDHIFGDFDNDGVDEFAYWVNRELKLYLAEIPTNPKTTTDPWPATLIASFSGSARPEGIDKADIDLDGIDDIVGGGHWFKLQSNGSFQTMVIDSNKRFTRTAVGQLIEGGRPEVIIDSGDVVGNLTLYQWDGASWIPTDLLGEQSHFGHSLNIGDVDGDGHLDIFSAEMTIQSNTNSQMRILYGDGVGGFTLSELDIGFEDHETKLGDLDGDGDLDILRKPFKNFKNGTPAIDIWINEGPNPFSFWNRTVADSSVPWRTIFLEYGDIDKDGHIDLITGGWWWKNPGTVSGNWVRQTIGSPMNQMATVYDFDSDGDLDVIGTAAIGSEANSNLHWAENDGTGNFTIHNNVELATGTFLQGVTVAEFMPGQLQIALSWQNGNGGLQLVNVPPAITITTHQWTVGAINGVISEGEGLDHGDIDNDGDLDILTGINWLRNDGSGNWTQISMFNPTEGQSDRNLLVDMDGDDDLDAVIGYGHDPVGKLRWYEQPNNNPEQLWIEHFVTNLAPAFAQSVDVADFDGDGDLDLSVGEHKNPDPGGLKLLLFENAGNDSWIRHEVYTGDEHHDAAHLVDLDTDGDLDIISIGWKHRKLLVYENQFPLIN